MKYGLVKEILIALVLLSLIVGNTWDAEATQRDTRQTKHSDYSDVKQKNETKSAFQQSYDIIADGFNDTYMTTKKPSTATVATDSDASTTEQYRITRKELGYILGRNYRGLKKLFNIEWNDVINQSKYNIEEYRQEKGHALYPYTIKKNLPPPKIAVSTSN